MQDPLAMQHLENQLYILFSRGIAFITGVSLNEKIIKKFGSVKFFIFLNFGTS